MGGDSSLNVTIGSEDGGAQWQDWLEDDRYDSQEEALGKDQEHEARMDLLREAMVDLNDRERHIIQERRLAEKPKTLEDLAQIYKVSRERIRQIEARAMEKLQKTMLENAQKTGLIEG
jgi:RNA polymerase sigma-32 factor